MSVEPELKQRLIELIYELLPEAEAVELRKRIETDPDVAKAYAEAQATSNVFAEAARLEGPKVALERPKGESAVTPSASRKKSTRGAAGRVAPWTRAANWGVGIASALLLLLCLSGYLYHRGQVDDIAAEHVRFQVTGPAKLQPGVDNTYSIVTTSITGKPLPAQIEFALHTPDGKRQLIGYREQADDLGRLNIAVPAKLKIESGAKLSIACVHDGRREQIDTKLSVERLRYVTHLSTDKPLYRPGETIRYRSLTLSRFGLEPQESVPIRFEILDPRDATVPGSQLQGVTERGVGNGQLVIPPGLPGGEYTLVARSMSGLFSEERRTFAIRGYRLPRLKKELEFTRDSYTPGDKVVADLSADRAEGGPASKATLKITATVDGKTIFEENGKKLSTSGSARIEFALPEEIKRGAGQLAIVVDDSGSRETIAKTIPIQLGTVDVTFYPEGGDLVAGLENRVYFIARDSLGEPVHIEGNIKNSNDQTVAIVKTTHEGMGAFTFHAKEGETYTLALENLPEMDTNPPLPKVSTARKIVLTTGLGVFPKDGPIEFNVRSTEAGLPLVATASCRGVQVGQEAFVTGSGANEVSVSLDASAGGVIRLTLYDYGQSPPQPVAERLVYRRPKRKLNVEVTGIDKTYAPGEPVKLSLAVTDESGRPTPAVLGVCVVDDAMLNLADDDHPAMDVHFLLASEVEKPEDLEELDFYLSDETEAEVALDLLLGTQGWRRFVERSIEELIRSEREGREDHDPKELVRLAGLAGGATPSAMFDNLSKLQTDYHDRLDAYQTNRTRTLNTLTTLSLFGGLGLLLLVAMLSLLKIVSGVRLWIPSVVSAAVCLYVGVMLWDFSRFDSTSHDAVAFASFDMEPKPRKAQPESTIDGTTSLGEDPNFYFGDGHAEFFDGNMQGRYDVLWNRFGVDDLDGGKGGPGGLLGQAFRDELGAIDRNVDADEPFGNGIDHQVAKEGRKRLAGWDDRFDGEWEMDEKEIDGGHFVHALKAGEGRIDLSQHRFTVRQYAHQHVAIEQDAETPAARSDFTETLYWHPLEVTDADGRVEIAFDLSDAVTTFRVQSDVHAAGGRIGSTSAEIVSRIPFNLEPKLPLEVTAGDRIDLPVAVVNDSARKLPVEVAIQCGELMRPEGERVQKLSLDAGRRARVYFPLEVSGEKGDGELEVLGTAGKLADTVRRPMSIVPRGFPTRLSYSGEIDGQQKIDVRLPDDWEPGSLEVSLNVFPSTLADLQKGMEGLLREPNGCFEQASTSNYPNVLSLQYMNEHDVADPDVTRRARKMLKNGYAKLVGYECSKKGYEWFGGDPGHEALTAYGLMEFRDMAEVYDVDPEMLERTAAWLLSRRDGKGRFERNAKSLDSFGSAPQDITDAYITWALTESGQKDIEREVAYVAKRAAESNDPYLIALAAAATLNADKKNDGRKLLEKLVKLQDDDGHLEGKDGSITRSGGLSLKVETTALAALAWLKLDGFQDPARRAVEWMIENRQGTGGFGSTQATILALKCLIEHTKANQRTAEAGKLIVRRNDEVLDEQAFDAGHKKTIVVEGLHAKLKPGENKLSIELTGNNQLPYALDVAYRSDQPADDEACPVRLSTKLAAKKTSAGKTVALSAELINTTKKGQPMTVAILGLPAGLEVRTDQLDEIKKAGTFDAYEIRNREVVCYWRCLAPSRKVNINLDLIAAIPGHYTGPASRAYLYYTAEQKQWNAPLAIEIARE